MCIYIYTTWTTKIILQWVFYRPNTIDIENELLAENSNGLKKYDYDNKILESEKNDKQVSLYVPEIEEMRYSCAIAKKGYIDVLLGETQTWEKQWIVREYFKLHVKIFWTKRIHQ